MSSAPVVTGTRPRRGPAAHLRLDVAEWLLLRGLLIEGVRGASTPPDFDPPAFGLDPQDPMTTGERDRAWASLVTRGLAGDTGTHDLAALTPGFVIGLLGLLQARLHVDVISWTGRVGVHQSVAWAGDRTVALARRRRSVPQDGGEVAQEQEPVVELSIGGDGSLLHELSRSLPSHDPAGSAGPSSPVRIGWRESAAVAHALRTGREDVAGHLSGLPPEALALLGSVSTTLVGGASVSIRQDGTTPHVHGAWLWTETDVVELLDATTETVALRRTTTSRLRTDLLSTITRLLHAEEAL